MFVVRTSFSPYISRFKRCDSEKPGFWPNLGGQRNISKKPGFWPCDSEKPGFWPNLRAQKKYLEKPGFWAPCGETGFLPASARPHAISRKNPVSGLVRTGFKRCEFEYN